MGKHLRSTVWLFWDRTKVGVGLGRVEQGAVYTIDSRSIAVELKRDGMVTSRVVLHRDDARMMARRIEQCLEASNG